MGIQYRGMSWILNRGLDQEVLLCSRGWSGRANSSVTPCGNKELLQTSLLYLPGIIFELDHLSEFLDNLGGKTLRGETMLPVKYSK